MAMELRMLRLIWILPMILAVQPAHAWGDDGHRLIARAASQLVSADVLRKAQAILDTDTSGLVRDTSLAEQATWADKYRDSDRNGNKQRYNATSAWHFIDIEIGAPDIDAACFGFPSLPRGTPASQGVAKDCVTNKIAQFTDELRSTATSDAERLRALQFLLHLVGDLHQPLHAGEDHDRGGNDKWIVSPAPRRSDLHYYWDTWFLRQLAPDFDTSLVQVLALATGPQRREWERGTPRDWTEESFRISRDTVYAPLPQPGADGNYRLDDDYVTRANSAVRTQLARAAVRLAKILQQSLGESKVTPRR
jgi:hypothetical protein